MWVLIAALLATAVKVVLALKTYGTDDVMLYFKYGMAMYQHGLARAFDDPQFNLTPLAVGYPSMLMEVLARNRNWFPFALKMPGILSYLGTVLAMIWLQRGAVRIPTYALVLFAASPVSVLIDGFHGNLDSNMVFALVVAGCACAPGRSSWVLCSICLAVACQVKVVALLAAPAFWFFWLHRGRGWQFLLVTGALVLLGWLPGFVANPKGFLSNVLAYGSVWGMWGFTFLLRMTGHPSLQEIAWAGLSRSQIVISQMLKLIIVGATIFAAWRNRKGDVSVLFSTIAFTWLVFFAFTPGLGVQYLVWVAPFLLVWNARWYVGVTILSTLLLLPYYYVSCGGFSWGRAYTWNFAKYYPFLLIPWAVFLGCAIAFVAKGGLRLGKREENAPAAGGYAVAE